MYHSGELILTKREREGTGEPDILKVSHECTIYGKLFLMPTYIKFI